MELTQLIGQVGFPIAVTCWMLLKLDAKLGAFERAAVAIAQRLEDQALRCNECREHRRLTAGCGSRKEG